MKKFFKVATEGQATDGRNISRQWIEQMAKNYSQEKYGARVWLEHLRGVLPDGPFNALGDVTALKTKDNAEGKLQLLAEIDPTEDLVAINKKRQKIYTSIEVDPEFSDTGEAYLTGLAVTDSPASLGTEMLQFSAQAENNPLNARKQRPENLFTAAVETELDFSEESEGNDPNEPSLFDRVKALFSQHRENGAAKFADFKQDLEKTLGLFVTEAQALRTDLDKAKGEYSELKQSHDALQTQFKELKAELDKSPHNHSQRPPATGSDNENLTDC